MPVVTSDGQLAQIRHDLAGFGLHNEGLMDDVLDHVCCMVEEGMAEGEDFNSSYREVLDAIDTGQIKLIQHQTTLNLDKRFQKMKNFTYVFGLSSALLTIVGSLFKRMHWPGAGILITVGILLVTFVFLPLYFRISYKEQAEKQHPVYPIVGYLTLAFLLLGALFKIMHWPGAGKIIYASVGFILLGFIPLYVVNVFRRSGSEKVRLPYIVMLLVGIAIVMLYSNVRHSKYYIDMYVEASVSADEGAAEISTSTLNLIEGADSLDAARVAAIRRIHDQALQLQQMIEDMQNTLKASVGQPGVALPDIKGKDNMSAGREAMLDEGQGGLLLSKAKAFGLIMEEHITDPVVRQQLADHLDFSGTIFGPGFAEKRVAENPLVVNYFKLADAARGIALAEHVAIVWLMEE